MFGGGVYQNFLGYNQKVFFFKVLLLLLHRMARMAGVFAQAKHLLREGVFDSPQLTHDYRRRSSSYCIQGRGVCASGWMTQRKRHRGFSPPLF